MSAERDDYLWDGSGDDPETKRLEGLLAPLRHDAPLEFRSPRRRRRAPWIAGGIAALAAAAAIAIVVTRGSGSSECGEGTPGFAFDADGEVVCNSRTVASGVLPVGGTLDTSAATARLDIADIGRAQLGEHTVIRLEQTGPNKHKLELDHGHMHAKVNAKPRLFEVGTPAANVTDLGCEYTLDIDPETHAGTISVDSGEVEIATPDHGVVVIHMNTHAAILPGHRPGLPVARGASPVVEAAVRAVDRGEPGALATLLRAATPRDAITVATVAVTVDHAQRAAVLARLSELSPPPSGLTVEDAEDPAMYGMWLDDVVVRTVRGTTP